MKAYKILDEIGQCSIDLFGQKNNPLPSLKHLLKEVQETIDEPMDEMEYADMLILLVGAFKRTGRTAQDLIDAALKKVEINKNRLWSNPDENGVCRHIDRVPINIWDDFYEDGFVPEGKKQKTYLYIEDYDIPLEKTKECLQMLLDYMHNELMLDREGVKMHIEFYDSELKYPNLVGQRGIVLFKRWEIKIENLTHERLHALLEELKEAQLAFKSVSIDFYSES